MKLIKKKKKKFWNSSSMNSSSIQRTQVHGTRVPLEYFQGTRVPFSRVL